MTERLGHHFSIHHFPIQEQMEPLGETTLHTNHNKRPLPAVGELSVASHSAIWLETAGCEPFRSRNDASDAPGESRTPPYVVPI